MELQKKKIKDFGNNSHSKSASTREGWGGYYLVTEEKQTKAHKGEGNQCPNSL